MHCAADRAGRATVQSTTASRTTAARRERTGSLRLHRQRVATARAAAVAATSSDRQLRIFHLRCAVVRINRTDGGVKQLFEAFRCALFILLVDTPRRFHTVANTRAGGPTRRGVKPLCASAVLTFENPISTIKFANS